MAFSAIACCHLSSAEGLITPIICSTPHVDIVFTSLGRHLAALGHLASKEAFHRAQPGWLPA